LTTGNCTQELRVTTNYSTETQLGYGNGYQMSNNSGEGFANGSKYCELLVFLNQSSTTTANATYAALNQSQVCVYYNQTATVTAPTFTNLVTPGVWWNGYGDISWTGTQVTFTRTATTVNGNGIENYLGTGFGFGYNNSATGNFSAGSDGITQVWRLKYNNGTHDFNIGYSFGDKANTGSMRLFASNISEAWWDDGTTIYNTGSVTLNNGFHTITNVANRTSYWIYVDGTLITSGNNGTTAVGTGDQLQLGNNWDGSAAYNVDLDFVRIMNDTLPPLTVSAGSQSNVNVTLLSTFKVFCFDESTNATLQCNIRALNSTSDYSVAYNSYYLNSSYPVGSLSLTANQSGFYNRSSTLTFSGVTNASKNIYLLNTSDASVIFVRFHVQTVNFAPITDATITISKYFGGTLTELAVQPVDGFGVASFYLDSTTTYVVNTVSTTYGSDSRTLAPAQNDYYITLGSGSGGVGTNYTYNFPPWCYDNISASFIPPNQNLFLGNNYVNQAIYATDNNLSFWGWNFYVNDALVNSSNNTNASGGVLSWLLYYNASNATGNASFHVFWARNNVSGQCDQYVFLRVFNMSVAGTSLVQAMQDIKSSTGLPAFGFQLLALLITALIIAFAARYTAVGGAIIGVIVLSIFALGNWVSWEVYLLLTIIGLLASYFIFSRGY
jgi:hypothetical protein